MERDLGEQRGGDRPQNVPVCFENNGHREPAPNSVDNYRKTLIMGSSGHKSIEALWATQSHRATTVQAKSVRLEMTASEALGAPLQSVVHQKKDCSRLHCIPPVTYFSVTTTPHDVVLLSDARTKNMALSGDLLRPGRDGNKSQLF